MHPLLRLFGYTRLYWLFLLLAFVGFSVNALSNILLIDLLQLIFDTIADSAKNATGIVSSGILYLFGDSPRDSEIFQWLAPLCVLLFASTRGLGLLGGIWGLGVVARTVVHDLRVQMYAQLIRSPLQMVENRDSGDQVSGFIFKVEQVAQLVTRALTRVLREGLLLLGLIIYMFYLSWQLSILLVIIMPLIVFLVRYAATYLRRYARRVQNSVGDLTRVSQNTIRCYREILIFGGENRARQEFNRASSYNRRQQLKVILVSALLQPLVQVLLALAMAVLLFLALSPEILARFSVGQVVAYLSAAGMIAKPARQLTQVIEILQRAQVALVDIFALIDSDCEPNTGTWKNDHSEGRVVFERVSFSYQAEGEPVLKEFSLVVEPGQTVALVGATGAGKSTLFNLLARFYDLKEGQGRILLDGIDIKDWDLHKLRKQMSMVSQNPVIFDDTLKNNIAFGVVQRADDSAILAAAEAAQVMEFAAQLPQGLDTHLGENGVLLSGGQVQRIAIARALLKKAPLLLFDEATTALDTATTQQVYKALRSLFKGRTAFLIAHQLQTIQFADLIVVMDKGRIVEQGKHEELLKADGHYARLYRYGNNLEPVAQTKTAAET